MISTNKFDLLFGIWGPVLLVTSFVLLPLPGATPAFLIAFLSFIATITGINKSKVIKSFFFMVVIYLSIYLISQFINILYSIELPIGVPLIDEEATSTFFLKSHITQSIYLLPGFFLFLAVKYYFRDKYWKYIDWGVKFLCFYGIYEFLFFIVFGNSGDFISNRSFSEVNSGSLVQVINVGGLTLQRMKSLTGEPSMFAFTLLPFFSYYFVTEKKFMSLLTGGCLILSTSTSAILGLLIFFIIDFFSAIANKLTVRLILKYIALTSLIILLFVVFKDFFLGLFLATQKKVALSDNSGIIRYSTFENGLKYWKELPFISKIFGIGFGTIRSNDLFITFLVNTGLIGVLFYAYSCIKPYFKLDFRNKENKGVAFGLIIILIISYVSVPEFSYLSIWFFLGLAYRKNRNVQ